jgi:hypothetical protein
LQCTDTVLCCVATHHRGAASHQVALQASVCSATAPSDSTRHTLRTQAQTTFRHRFSHYNKLKQTARSHQHKSIQLANRQHTRTHRHALHEDNTTSEHSMCTKDNSCCTNSTSARKQADATYRNTRVAPIHPRSIHASIGSLRICSGQHDKQSRKYRHKRLQACAT